MSNLPRLFLFDFDGTVVHFLHDHVGSVFSRALDAFGLPGLDPTIFMRKFSQDELFAYVPDSVRSEFIGHFYSSFAEEDEPLAPIITGTAETLEYIESIGAEAAIVTARATLPEPYRMLLSENNLLQHFKVISTRPEDDKEWRDKRHQIHDVCRSRGIAKEDACMIGDAVNDIMSGRIAGVGTVIGVLSGGIDREVLLRHDPCHVIPDISHIPSLFRD